MPSNTPTELLPGTLGNPAPMDWRMFLFLGGITVATAIVFGTLPALRSTAINVNSALKQSSRSVVSSRSLIGQRDEGKKTRCRR